MDRQGLKSSESRFAAYVEGLVSVIGHKDREGPLRDYCAGLMLGGERKSVEPIAAVTAPARVAAQHIEQYRRLQETSVRLPARRPSGKGIADARDALHRPLA